MKAGDSILRDVIAAIESHTKIRRQDVESWMHATDAHVLGAVSKLITEESSRRRIEPALSTTQLRDFHFRLYAQSMRENPQGDWALSRSEAAWHIVGWYRGLPAQAFPPDETLYADLKRWMESMYIAGSKEIREAILYCALEHILEQPRWRAFFSDWERKPELCEAYKLALEWARDHESH